MAMRVGGQCRCALLMAVLVVFCCCFSICNGQELTTEMEMAQRDAALKPCDEIYVVREGESLQTISEKCGDPYILEENPQINDQDDVFPGLVIKITSFRNMVYGTLR